MQRSVLTDEFSGLLLASGLSDAYLFMTLVPVTVGILCKLGINYKDSIFCLHTYIVEYRPHPLDIIEDSNSLQYRPPSVGDQHHESV